MPLVELIKSHLPASIRKTEMITTKGLLYLPNDNLRRGPKYLIRLNFPLQDGEIEWDTVVPFFNGGCEDTCRHFFGMCNGFSLSYRFSAPGILIHDPYDGQGLSYLNVPYDLRGQSYGSYPEFAPNAGYYVSKLRTGEGDHEICDIITPEGKIIFGAFRENCDVSGEFDSIEEWINIRIPQALIEMKNDSS